MTETLIVSIISLCGTLLGSLLGVLTANKLTQYRIDQLEKKVEDIKKDQDRIYKLETHNEVQDNHINSLISAIKRIEEKVL